MKLRFSIIIPVYRVEQYLEECVESVRNQTFQNYEIILVDDGSPDRCPQMCDSFQKEDDKIRVIHKENGGLSDARNVGLEYAGGEYVIFLDSDDYWADMSFLEKADIFLTQNQKKDDVDVILFQAKKIIEENGRVIEDVLYDQAVINASTLDETVKYLVSSMSYSMSACTKILKLDTIKKQNIYFTKGLLGEDLDWFLTLLFNVRNIYSIDSVNYVYRIRAGSITQTIGKKNLIDSVWMLGKWSEKIAGRKLNEENKIYYYAILAYAYVIALLNYQSLKPEDRNEVKEMLKPYHYLLQYSSNRRIRLTAISYKLVGFELTSRLLAIYYHSKK